jgi:hypothetical protein
MNDQLDVLKLIARSLEQAKIAYMISGSTAMNCYAQPRMTRDIDIVVELDLTDVKRLVTLFSADFYIDEETVQTAISNQSLFNIIHSELIVKVDFIVRKDTPYRKIEFQRRRLIALDDTKLWLVSPEDLLLSKLVWAKDSQSELQLRDVRNLIDSVDTLDWPYIRQWADVLTVTKLLGTL